MKNLRTPHQRQQWRRGGRATRPASSPLITPNSILVSGPKEISINASMDAKEGQEEKPQENKTRTKKRKEILIEETVTELITKEGSEEVKEGNDERGT